MGVRGASGEMSFPLAWRCFRSYLSLHLSIYLSIRAPTPPPRPPPPPPPYRIEVLSQNISVNLPEVSENGLSDRMNEGRKAISIIKQETKTPKRQRGLPYMTSAKCPDFFTPPSHIQKSADFVPSVCFLGTPSPTHCRRHIWKPPKFRPTLHPRPLPRPTQPSGKSTAKSISIPQECIHFLAPPSILPSFLPSSARWKCPRQREGWEGWDWGLALSRSRKQSIHSPRQ